MLLYLQGEEDVPVQGVLVTPGLHADTALVDNTPRLQFSEVRIKYQICFLTFVTQKYLTAYFRNLRTILPILIYFMNQYLFNTTCTLKRHQIYANFSGNKFKGHY